MFTPATRTRPSTGALAIALLTTLPRCRPTGWGRPTLAERRRAMATSSQQPFAVHEAHVCPLHGGKSEPRRGPYVSRRACHHLDRRLREAAAAGPRRGARGRGRPPRHRRALPAAVAPAGHVEDAPRSDARRARDRLRAPARARHAGRHALALPRRPPRRGDGRLPR